MTRPALRLGLIVLASIGLIISIAIIVVVCPIAGLYGGLKSGGDRWYYEFRRIWDAI